MALLPVLGTLHGKRGQVIDHVTVDDDLLPLLNTHTWQYDTHGMAARRIRVGQRVKFEPLHHFIWMHANRKTTLPAGHTVRHQNGDKSDYRASNLILVNNRVKIAAAPKHRDNTTGYKDVFSNRGGFAAYVGCGGKRMYVGKYATELETAYAVNLAYSELHPEVPPPNAIPPDALTPEEKIRVEANVDRLLRRRRSARS